jgi:hypothetical protein
MADMKIDRIVKLMLLDIHFNSFDLLIGGFQIKSPQGKANTKDCGAANETLIRGGNAIKFSKKILSLFCQQFVTNLGLTLVI